MSFEIYFSNNSKNFLKKCDKELYKRLIEKIQLLQDEPVPHNSVRIVGEERTFRIRIGDYRVVYEIKWEFNEILIAIIDKRTKAYD